MSTIPYEVTVSPPLQLWLEACEILPAPAERAECVLNQAFGSQACSYPSISTAAEGARNRELYANASGPFRLFRESSEATTSLRVGYFDPLERIKFHRCREEESKSSVVVEARVPSFNTRQRGVSGEDSPLRSGLEFALKVVDYVSLALIATPGGLVAFAGRKVLPRLAARTALWIARHRTVRVAAAVATQNYVKASAVLATHALQNDGSLWKPDPKFLSDWFGEGRYWVTVPASILFFAGIAVVSSRFKGPSEIILNTIFTRGAAQHQSERIKQSRRWREGGARERLAAEAVLREQAAGAWLIGGISLAAKGAELVADAAWLGTSLCAIDDVLPLLVARTP